MSCSRKVRPEMSTKTNYAGFRIPSKGSWSVPVVNMKDLSAAMFYERFVATRTPCVINGHPTDPEWHASGWSLARLAQLAGDVILPVEKRVKPSDEEEPQGSEAAYKVQPFGRGCKLPMPLRQVLDDIRGGSEDYYVSAQELPVLEEPDDGAGPTKRSKVSGGDADFGTDTDGEMMALSPASTLPAIVSPLPSIMMPLSVDFPLRLSLFPSLVPQQVRVHSCRCSFVLLNPANLCSACAVFRECLVAL